MRGRELGLEGQDLMIFQMGEVVQIGVKIEKALEKWIEDCWSWFGTPKDERLMPLALKAKVRIAKKLLRSWGYAPEHYAAMLSALGGVFDSMQKRNRIIHDQWVAFPDQPGVVTRLGYLAAYANDDGEKVGSRELRPGIGSGEFTHEEWEDLRTELFHAWWRLTTFTLVRPEPDGTFFFGQVEENFELIRGEFYLGRDYMVPWSWADNTPDFAPAQETA